MRALNIHHKSFRKRSIRKMMGVIVGFMLGNIIEGNINLQVLNSASFGVEVVPSQSWQVHYAAYIRTRNLMGALRVE